ILFFFSSRRRHTRWPRDWSSDVCSSDLNNFKVIFGGEVAALARAQVPVHAEITIGHNANVGERDGCDGELEERGSCGDYSSRGKIGRASCRERGWSGGGGRSAKRKERDA